MITYMYRYHWCFGPLPATAPHRGPLVSLEGHCDYLGAGKAPHDVWEHIDFRHIVSLDRTTFLDLFPK